MARVLACALAALALIAPIGRAAEKPPPTLAEKCGPDTSGVTAQPFWLTTADRAQLYTIEAGSGPVGLVLAHESPGDLCGWLPYVSTLTASGLRVLAFDFRGFGSSRAPAPAKDYYAYDRDLRAAVARLRADGATRVFLVGASFGGAAILTYAPRLAVDGVISLSGEAKLLTRKLNGLAAIRRLRAPLLIVGSRRDPYLPVSDALKLLRRAGSKDKRTALYPGSYHGWEIVETAPYAASARALILGWIRTRSA
jgi:alpha-beta hydrolase superfamily lysophospholipase